MFCYGPGASMNLDEWVSIVKTLGPDEFKPVAVAFLREYFGRTVLYTDGPGDEGVDAWVLLQPEPRLRVAAQFHSGKSQAWDKKLDDDVAKLVERRSKLAVDDPAWIELSKLYFVCSQTPTPAAVEIETRRIQLAHSLSVQVFDARSVVSTAFSQRGELLALLASRVPGQAPVSKPLPDARDEALLTFSFFHDAPDKFRRAVARCAIATTLHQHGGTCARDALCTEAARLLRLAPPSRLVEHALRDLANEAMIVDADPVRAAEALTNRTVAALTIAAKDERNLREACAKLVEPLVPKGRHQRETVAQRAVAAVFDDLGALVRAPIAEHVRLAVDPGSRGRFERNAAQRWRKAATRFADELGDDDHGRQALAKVVRAIAEAPFAKQLASAELFMQITEHDALEFERALSNPTRRVMFDTTIALPILCALLSKPIPTWRTSSAAHELYLSLHARGAQMAVASVHLEEIASHLLNARPYRHTIADTQDLRSSKNYFVAHYSRRKDAADPSRRREGFVEFLQDFGAPAAENAPWYAQRAQTQEKVRGHLSRYGIAVEEIDHGMTDPLPNEPVREATVLDHDRALNHYRDGVRSFPGARQWFDLISTALIRSARLRRPSRARYSSCAALAQVRSVDRVFSGRVAAGDAEPARDPRARPQRARGPDRARPPIQRRRWLPAEPPGARRVDRHGRERGFGRSVGHHRADREGPARRPCAPAKGPRVSRRVARAPGHRRRRRHGRRVGALSRHGLARRAVIHSRQRGNRLIRWHRDRIDDQSNAHRSSVRDAHRPRARAPRLAAARRARAR
jgi:hypothetical protein